MDEERREEIMQKFDMVRKYIIDGGRITRKSNSH